MESKRVPVETEKEKRVSITIHWGSRSHRAENPEQEPVLYEFATNAGLGAFCSGVYESNGYMEYEALEVNGIDPRL